MYTSENLRKLRKNEDFKMATHFNKAFITITLLSLLTGCGGSGSNSENDQYTETAVDSSDDNTTTDSSGGGATSTFTAALGVATANNASRIESMKAMANIVYADNNIESGTLNYDYKQGNEVGYYLTDANDGTLHTGVDIQSGQSSSSIKIGSLVNGTIVDINNDFGAIVVQTLIDDTPYHISFLHLGNIQVEIGDEVTQGQTLGFESNTSKYNISQHLHVEVFTPCMETIQNQLLDVKPDATTWEFAVDPISIMYGILERGSSTPTHKTHFVNVSFNEGNSFVPGVQNQLQGCAFNSGGFEEQLTFQILDKDSAVLSSETYNIKAANNLFAAQTVADLRDYKFGTEPDFLAGGTASKLGITLQQKNDTKTTYDLDVSSLPPEEDRSTSIDLELAGNYFYFSDAIELQGCIDDPDGIESLTIKVFDKKNNTWLQPYTRGLGQEDTLDGLEACSPELENSKSLNSVKYKSPYNVPLGSYSMYLEVVDTNGYITDSETLEFEVKNSVASVEHTTGNPIAGGSNKFVIKRIENDEQYHQIVNLPQSCLRFAINENIKIIYGNVEQADDLGIYRQYFNTYFTAVQVPAGAHYYEFYSQCDQTDPKVILSDGIFTFE